MEVENMTTMRYRTATSTNLARIGMLVSDEKDPSTAAADQLQSTGPVVPDISFTVILVVAAVCAFVILFLLFLLIYFYCRKRRFHRQQRKLRCINQQSHIPTSHNGSDLAGRYPPQSLGLLYPAVMEEDSQSPVLALPHQHRSLIYNCQSPSVLTAGSSSSFLGRGMSGPSVFQTTQLSGPYGSESLLMPVTTFAGSSSQPAEHSSVLFSGIPRSVTFPQEQQHLSSLDSPATMLIPEVSVASSTPNPTATVHTAGLTSLNTTSPATTVTDVAIVAPPQHQHILRPMMCVAQSQSASQIPTTSSSSAGGLPQLKGFPVASTSVSNGTSKVATTVPNSESCHYPQDTAILSNNNCKPQEEKCARNQFGDITTGVMAWDQPDGAVAGLSFSDEGMMASSPTTPPTQTTGTASTNVMTLLPDSKKVFYEVIV